MRDSALHILNAWAYWMPIGAMSVGDLISFRKSIDVYPASINSCVHCGRFSSVFNQFVMLTYRWIA